MWMFHKNPYKRLLFVSIIFLETSSPSSITTDSLLQCRSKIHMSLVQNWMYLSCTGPKVLDSWTPIPKRLGWWGSHLFLSIPNPWEKTQILVSSVWSHLLLWPCARLKPWSLAEVLLHESHIQDKVWHPYMLNKRGRISGCKIGWCRCSAQYRTCRNSKFRNKASRALK